MYIKMKVIQNSVFDDPIGCKDVFNPYYISSNYAEGLHFSALITKVTVNRLQ